METLWGTLPDFGAELNPFFLEPLFAKGKALNAPQLTALRQEDDSVVLPLDGRSPLLEQANPGVNAAFDLIGLTQLRNDARFAGIDGSGMSVAVIDTGLDRYHPLLESAYLTGYDFVTQTPTSFDSLEHGTHVAGIIGARDENIGVATDADLIGLQVFRNGYASNSRIEDALEWVLANHTRYNIVAVNMSLGGGFFTSESQSQFSLLYDDVQRLEAAGITVVSAAGNAYKSNQTQNLAEPAIFSTLAVGAVWKDGVNSNVWFGDGAIDYTTGSDRIASFSQRKTGPNTLFAPGAYISSTIPGGGLAQMAGTSMASPMVAGAVALMQEAAMTFGGRLLSPDEIVEILRTTGDRIVDGDDEHDNVANTNTSYPRLNVYNAVSEIYERFRAIAPSPIPIALVGDANGTLSGAILAPALTGGAASPINGSIGTDGNGEFIGNTDVDLYRFTVASPGDVTLALSAHTTQPANFDSYLRLFNSSGQELATDDESGTGDFSRLIYSLSPGTYYAGVSGDPNRTYNPNQAGSGTAGGTGNYALRLYLNNADTDGLLSGAMAVNPGTMQAPFTTQGSIGMDGSKAIAVADVDMFALYAPDTGQLLIDIDTPFADGQFVDSYLRVFDEHGRELAFNNNALAVNELGQPTEFTNTASVNRVYTSSSSPSGFTGHTTDSFLAAQVQGGRTYYVAVSDSLNSAYDPTDLSTRPSATQTGLYNLAIAFASNDQNGTIDQAKRLPVLPLSGQRQFQTIGRDGGVQVGDRDIDIFRVRPTTSGILDLDIDSRTGTALTDAVDTVAYLFDGAGNLLGRNDDQDGLDPGLRFQVNANTNYYVAIAGYGNGGFDPVQLGSGSTGDTGDYFISSRLLTGSAATLTDNTLAAAGVQSVEVGSIVSGTLGEDSGFIVGAADVDLYRFIPTASGIVTIRTLATEAFTADTYLRVFDASGMELVANDDENAITRGSAVQLTVNAGTEYFIGVNGDSPLSRRYNPVTGLGSAPGSQGAYTLTLSPASATGVAGITLTGTPGDDTLTGTDGDDFLTGQHGKDVLLGLLGNDTLVGNGGKDILEGHAGADWLTGGGGKDGLRGGNGQDILSGGRGKDTLEGGAGDDRLAGEKGRDKLTGGDGDDLFILTAKGGRDRIFDYEDGRDRLGLEDITFGDLSFTQRRKHVLIQVGDRKMALIEDVQVADLTVDDFTPI